MSTKQLLAGLIKLAQKQATEQLQDLRHLPEPANEEPKHAYLQLDLRDAACAAGGGRFVDEPFNAPGLNRNTREGEYKFVDETNLKLFWRIDGNPTAKRALLFTMFNNHKICEKTDVWMAFVGCIDDDLGLATSHPVRLQSILGPQKFWDNLPKEHPNFEALLEDTDGEVNTDFCRPFWSFAFEVIRDAPHMLKPGYTTHHGGKKIERFSWARMLVLMFLPEAQLIEKLTLAGLAKDSPAGWHQQARKKMKNTLIKRASVKLRSVIKNGWEDLCDELDKIYLENELYEDNPLANTTIPADTKHDSESPAVKLQGLQYSSFKAVVKPKPTGFADGSDGTTTDREESDNEDLVSPRSLDGESIASKIATRTRRQLPWVVQNGGMKRNRHVSVTSNHHTDSDEDVLMHKKQRTLPKRSTHSVVDNNTSTTLRYRLRSSRQLSKAQDLESQDLAEEDDATSSGDETMSTASIKPVSRRGHRVVADSHMESEDDKNPEVSDREGTEGSDSDESLENGIPKKMAAPKKKAAPKKPAPKESGPKKPAQKKAAAPKRPPPQKQHRRQRKLASLTG
jgi:hypothetical protein